MALEAPHIGHVIRETEDKIVVFGEVKSWIETTDRNVLIHLNLWNCREVQSKSWWAVAYRRTCREHVEYLEQNDIHTGMVGLIDSHRKQ
jgi:hypothetical protein